MYTKKEVAMQNKTIAVIQKCTVVIDRLNRLFEYVGLVLLSMMTIIVFVAIVSRFFAGISLSWVEESATFSMAWICALGAGLASRKGGMTTIEIGIMKFPFSVKKIIRVTACILSYIFFCTMILFGYKMAMVVRTQYATTIPFMSMFWVYVAMPVGFVIMFINSLAYMAEIIFSKEDAS